jgi:hypothetical protein
MPDEDTIADSVRPSVPPKQMRQRAAIEVAQQIANTLAPVIFGLPAEERGSEALLLQAIARTMTAEVVGSLAVALKDLDQAEGTKEVMNGDIGAIPLAEVLQVLQMQRQTGVLRITNSRTIMTISIRQGLIDLVQSRGASDEFRLGRYFIERGLVGREELDRVIKDRGSNPGPRLLGDALVDSGKISKEDLSDALTRQSSELIYDVLRWPFGRFSFAKEAFRPEAEAAKLGIGISGLVLEGFRRVDEWRLMEGTINFDSVVIVNQVALDSVDDAKLTRIDKLVLGCVDGTRTVSEVIKESAVGSFDGIKAIYQFLQSRVIRNRA